MEQTVYGVGILFLAVLSQEDIKEKRVSVRKLLFFAVSGIAYRLLVRPLDINELVGSLVPGAFLLFLAVLTRESIGFGDGIVVLILGLWIGGALTTISVCVGILGAGICGCIYLIAKRKEPIPFVPFLLLGMEVGLIYV